MSAKINGNRVKGTKGRHKRKEVHAAFDPETDSYARVISGLGNCQMSVQLLDDPSAKPVNAHIRGIHRGKLFFRPETFVVVRHSGNIREIWGFVPECDVRKVQADFAKVNGKEDKSSIIFRDANEIDDLSSDDEVPLQPTQSLLSTLDIIKEERVLDIDSI